MEGELRGAAEGTADEEARRCARARSHALSITAGSPSARMTTTPPSRTSHGSLELVNLNAAARQRDAMSLNTIRELCRGVILPGAVSQWMTQAVTKLDLNTCTANEVRDLLSTAFGGIPGIPQAVDGTDERLPLGRSNQARCSLASRR